MSRSYEQDNLLPREYKTNRLLLSSSWQTQSYFVMPSINVLVSFDPTVKIPIARMPEKIKIAIIHIWVPFQFVHPN